MKNSDQPGIMTLEEVRGILGLGTTNSVYHWLRRHGVPVVSSRVSARLFYAVWEPEPFDAGAVLERLRRP